MPCIEALLSITQDKTFTIYNGSSLCLTSIKYVHYPFQHAAEDLVFNNRLAIDPDVKAVLEAEEVKHRKHPGIMQVKKVKLPQRLLDSVNLLMESKWSGFLWQFYVTVSCYILLWQSPAQHREAFLNV